MDDPDDTRWDGVRQHEKVDPIRVFCVFVGCDWRGAAVDPEVEALDHAAANAGHLTILEHNGFTEYLKELPR